MTSIVAGAGLLGGTINTSGTVAVDPASTTLTANFFRQGGNTFGAPAHPGTNDGNPVEIYANGSRVMRYEPNATSPNIIGGHPSNSASGGYYGQTIAGGGQAGTNCFEPSDSSSTRSCATARQVSWQPSAAASPGNTASDADATVGGGGSNTASGPQSTVAGGTVNTASQFYSTISGGTNNTANGASATVAGGSANTAGGAAAVGGGASNVASGGYSAIAGGQGNSALDYASVAGGLNNTASGVYSTVAGGQGNAASGAWSFAAGHNAKTQDPLGTPVHSGAFVWADYSNFDFNSAAANEFAVRATGGVRLVLAIDGSTGAPTWTCAVASGGSWACSSDRNQKQNLRQLDGQAVLAQLANVPIYQWNPKGENAHLRHYGPTAQDFYAAFGLGDSELRIGQQDADGVALAAIQGLSTKVAEQQRQLAELTERVEKAETLAADVAALKAALAELQRTRANVAAK